MSAKIRTKESGPFGVVEDGFGSAWRKCAPDCCIEVVRPGKVQCDPSRCVVVRDANRPKTDELTSLRAVEAASRAALTEYDKDAENLDAVASKMEALRAELEGK